jgi:hypothetical protein
MADAIETVEDSSYAWGTAPHIHVAQSLGVTNVSERTAQRMMADHGVGTYVAAQAKFLSKKNMEERVAYAPSLGVISLKKRDIRTDFQTKATLD